MLFVFNLLIATKGVRVITKNKLILSSILVLGFWIFILSKNSFAYPLNSSFLDYSGGGDKHLQEIADINGDGYVDLITTNGDNPGFYLSLGNGDGTFQTEQNFVSTAYAVGLAVSDLDGINGLDVIVVNNGGGASISVFLNDGSGGFLPPANYSAPNADGSKAFASRVVLDDLDGQGGLDVAVTGNAGNEYYIFKNPSGSGVLDPATTYPSAGLTPTDIKTGDFDGDGDKDLIISNFDSDTVSIDLNDGSGVFTNAGSFAVMSGPVDVTVADYDKNGLPDFAVSNYNSSTITVGLNNGSLSFNTTSYAGTNYPIQNDSGDLNADGYTDIVVAGNSPTILSVYLNMGDGTFSNSPDTYSSLGNGFGVNLSDLNNDCTLDAVVSEHGMGVEALLGSPAPGLHINASSCTQTSDQFDTNEEGSTSDTINIGITGTPKEDVVITCIVAPADQVTYSPNPLEFTVPASDSSQMFAITITAIDDSSVESTQVASVDCVTKSDDLLFYNLALSIPVSVLDNDENPDPIPPIDAPATTNSANTTTEPVLAETGVNTLIYAATAIVTMAGSILLSIVINTKQKIKL